MARKQGMQGFRPKLVSLAVASCFASGAALANPTGGVTVHGRAAAITNPQAHVLQIQTYDPKTIINWNSFSISVGELTRFLQPSAASAVLNRVVGGDPSAILGALQSNGRVLLVNPSGIIFGAGAQIDVAGLVATSLNLSNADFLANRMKFADVPGAGSVVNNGNITTGQGGQVYLVGPAVTNNGIITSPKGEVVLAAGNSVELVNPGTPNLRVEVAAAGNEARNIGQIISESGRVGIYAGLINNSGTVNASSAVAKGGKIMLQAKKSVTLESTSILDTSGAGGGTIEVLAKDSVKVDGRLDASAPVKGDGGFIETSADRVSIARSTVATTAAKKGKTGTFLIDPVDFFISYGGAPLDTAYGSGVGADTLVGLLDSNNFAIETKGDSGPSYGGSITVGADVVWNNSHSLTLRAHQDIFVNNKLHNSGTGGISLYAGWNGTKGSNVVNNSDGDIQVSAPITTGGDVILVAGGHASQTGTGAITADGLLIESRAQHANFDQAGNMVNTLAGKGTGFLFRNDKALTIGTVGGVSGITVTNNDCSSCNAPIAIYADGGNLTVNKNVTTENKAGPSFYGGSIELAAYGGKLSINNATVSATGTQSGGGASVTLVGTNGVSISGSTVRARGGDGAEGGGSALIDISSSGTLSVNNGSTVEALGGKGTNSSTGGAAEVFLFSGSAATVRIEGGSKVRAIGGAGAGGPGDAEMFISDSSGDVVITNSTIQVDGAEGLLLLGAEGDLKISGSAISVNAQSGDALIQMGAEGELSATTSTLSATAPTTGEGAGAAVIIGTAPTINTSGSTLSAFGTQSSSGPIVQAEEPSPSSPSGVGLLADGDITLGSLVSNDFVSVVSNTGRIIDGNSGGNVSAVNAILSGNSGVGTVANPLETAITNLVVMAYGGEIGIINSGNLALLALQNSGSGASAVGTTGTMVFDAPISVSGNLSLLANNGMVVQQNISSGGNLLLDSGIGDLAFDGVGVFGNNVTLNGNNILVGFTTSTQPTTVGATNLMKVTTLGNLNVLGGANSSANALLHGGVDVDLTVGQVAGFVNVAGGSAGASAQIAAGSPDTIKLFFPKLASGGFFVNGNEGVISDGNTGFFVNGLPAVLDENFFVTYGAAELPPAVQQAINQVVANTNQQSDLTSGVVNETGNVEGEEDKEKKQLPICSR